MRTSRAMTVLMIPAVLGGLLTLPLGAQSLAELAKKEKERRTQVQSKVQVLSNQDVDKFRKGAVSTAASAPAPAPAPPPEKQVEPQVQPVAAAPPGAAAPVSPTSQKDEAYWRGRQKELVDKARALDNKQVATQLEINDLWNRFYREQDGFYRETIQKNISKKSGDLKQLEDDLKAVQKEIENLKKEARQNNVPAGWIR